MNVFAEVLGRIYNLPHAAKIYIDTYVFLPTNALICSLNSNKLLSNMPTPESPAEQGAVKEH